MSKAVHVITNILALAVLPGLAVAAPSPNEPQAGTASYPFAQSVLTQGAQVQAPHTQDMITISPQTPSPGEIIAATTPDDWVGIAPEDLLVMQLAPAADGTARTIILQLMPEPFSQGWVRNVRTLARAHWYDGTSINRVQDNYVVQWGDPDGEEPAKAKPLPEGLLVMDEDAYTISNPFTPELADSYNTSLQSMIYFYLRNGMQASGKMVEFPDDFINFIEDGEPADKDTRSSELLFLGDRYAMISSYLLGWPLANGYRDSVAEKSGSTGKNRFWPIHCYGMVGVGRGMPPDTGTGAELYTVIGQAPRHLDRNIALIGRIIAGMEHLTALPRGTGELGFYENASQRIPIESIRLASTLPKDQQPRFEYLNTERLMFGAYLHARANRSAPFFISPAGGVDICNAPVPVRPMNRP